MNHGWKWLNLSNFTLIEKNLPIECYIYKKKRHISCSNFYYLYKCVYVYKYVYMGALHTSKVYFTNILGRNTDTHCSNK